MDRLRRRLGRRALLHRLRAAARRRDDGALRGQAGRHPRRGRVLAGRSASTACGRCSPHRPRSARSARPTPRRQRLAEVRHLLAADAVRRRRAARPRHLRVGHRRFSAPRRRPLVADRDRLADLREPARPRADADQARLAHASPVPGYRRRDRSTPRATRLRRHRGQHRASRCRCRRARSPGCGATRTDTSGRTCPRSPATTSPATPATSTRTATSTSWAAATTSSTLPGTAFRPAAWRPCSPGTRRSPNAR